MRFGLFRWIKQGYKRPLPKVRDEEVLSDFAVLRDVICSRLLYAVDMIVLIAGGPRPGSLASHCQASTPVSAAEAVITRLSVIDAETIKIHSGPTPSPTLSCSAIGK
jgi:hypothetical protein